jgi:uncharacterized protein (TIGR02246 family)
MKMLRAVRYPAFAVAMLAVSIAHADPEAETAALLQRWAAAFNAGDVEQMLPLYAPDATLLGTGSPEMLAKEEGVRSYFARPFKRKYQVRMGGAVTSRLADRVLVVTGDFEFVGTRGDGSDFVTPSRYTFVLAKQGAEWRIVHHHSSPRPRPLH